MKNQRFFKLFGTLLVPALFLAGCNITLDAPLEEFFDKETEVITTRPVEVGASVVIGTDGYVCVDSGTAEIKLPVDNPQGYDLDASVLDNDGNVYSAAYNDGAIVITLHSPMDTDFEETLKLTVKTKDGRLLLRQSIPVALVNFDVELATINLSPLPLGVTAPVLVSNIYDYTVAKVAADFILTAVPNNTAATVSMSITNEGILTQPFLTETRVLPPLNSSVVTIVVTAPHGAKKQSYSLSLNRPDASTSALITSFNFAAGSDLAVISDSGSTITQTVPAGTPLDNVSLTDKLVVSPGASFSPETANFIKEDQSAFTPVIITVTAEDGVTKKDYAVTVSWAVPPKPSTPSFVNWAGGKATVSWAGVAGATGYDVYYGSNADPGPSPTVSKQTILTYQTDVIAVTNYLRVRAYNISGAGEWSDPLTLNPLSSEALITSFAYEGKTAVPGDGIVNSGSAAGSTITLKGLPVGTGLRDVDLTDRVEVSAGASFSVTKGAGSGQKKAHFATADYSDVNPVIITVTAADGWTTKTYGVTITRYPGVPTGVSVSSVSIGEIEVNWTAPEPPAEAGSYELLMRTNASPAPDAGTSPTLTGVTATSTTITISTGTQYVWVRARSAADTDLAGDWSLRGSGAAKTLAEILAALTPNDAATPHPVRLPADTVISEAWGNINSTVRSNKKYVILDLSDCPDTTVSGGSLSQSDNDMNVIQNNPYIKGIILPDSLASIGNYAFYLCRGLTSVVIPSGVTTIGDNAFRYCEGLTDITIPSGVTDIGSFAFSNCTGLTDITIPGTVTTIGNYAFDGCTGLTGINVDPGNSYYSSVDGVLFNRTKTTLVRYPNGKSGTYSIPSGVTTIGDSAFRGFTGLTSVTIPGTVTTIGNAAFYGCTGLTGVTIPSGVTTIGNSAFRGCTGLTGVTIPSGVTTIGHYAFDGCTGLTSVTIPSGVTTIGEGTFDGCAELTSITIPSGVTTIGYRAFYGCTKLTGVTIPGTVTTIESFAFYQCAGLTSIIIPGTVTTIGTYAFRATNLTSVTFSTGSNIEKDDFVDRAFPSDSSGENALRTAYLAASPKAGTYTRPAGNGDWTKQ